jgi:hypothetical protein
MSNFDGINEYLIPQVRVYRNLHTGTLSMQKRIKGKGWRVVAHPAGVILTDVKFVVNEGGRQRVLKEKKKNVHAYIQGTLRLQLDEGSDRHFNTEPGWATGKRAKYNPYKYDSWVDDEGFRVENADTVVVTADGMVTFRN